MLILVIEDNSDIAANLGDYLEERGHTVDFAADGVTGLHLAVVHEFDAIVLDLNLPGMDGLEVCRKLRNEARKQTPVLMLTARDTLDNKLAGFDSGADDYLIKPFAFSELLARVRTLLRRGNGSPTQTTMKIADLEVDLMKRRAVRGGKRIDLTAKEFSLLELLLRRRGEVLPKSLIASQVWDMNFDSDTNVIEVAIRRLRAKIDDDFDLKLIHTARGMGYMMDAPE